MFYLLPRTGVPDDAEPETEAMLYGTSFHTAAEEYVRDGAELPPQFEYARKVLDSLNDKEFEILKPSNSYQW